jgi:hypothetical protein
LQNFLCNLRVGSMHTYALPAPLSHPFRWRSPRSSRSLRFEPRGEVGTRPRGSALSGDPGHAGSAPDLRMQPAVVRRAQLVALAVGGFLLPWSVLLAVTLPTAATAQHWALAWSGLDVAEAAAALATAVLLARDDRRASLPAAAGGTLLLIDAWFDVCTSAPGAAHAMALAEAGCLEIPLAVAAWWLSLTLTRNGSL